MSEMVKHIANAMRDCKTAEEAAVAAIKAMRKPTQFMIDAGYELGSEATWDHDATNGDPEETWKVMINAALK